jgi:hypothetical protein
MKDFFKKHYKKLILFFTDFSAVVAFIIANPLSGFMLSLDSECGWKRFGFECGTCGGTHFVNDLTSGRILSAFFDNQFLFIVTLFFFVSLILLHFLWLGKSKLAKRILRIMYSIPSLVILVSGFFVFTLLRNLPQLINLFERFFETLSSGQL